MNSLVDDLGTRLGRKASKRSNEMGNVSVSSLPIHIDISLSTWQVELIYMVPSPFFSTLCVRTLLHWVEIKISVKTVADTPNQQQRTYLGHSWSLAAAVSPKMCLNIISFATGKRRSVRGLTSRSFSCKPCSIWCCTGSLDIASSTVTVLYEGDQFIIKWVSVVCLPFKKNTITPYDFLQHQFLIPQATIRLKPLVQYLQHISSL